jgi:hypothetical protein
LFLGVSYRNATLASEATGTRAFIFPSPGGETSRVNFIGGRAGVTLNVNSMFGIVAETSADFSSRTIVTPRPCSQPSPNSFCFRTGPEFIFIYQLLTGLRVSKRSDPIDPFFQILLGPLGGGAGGVFGNGITMAFGGGLNFNSTDPLPLRLQVESASKHIVNHWSNDIQIAFGPIITFGQ